MQVGAAREGVADSRVAGDVVREGGQVGRRREGGEVDRESTGQSCSRSLPRALTSSSGLKGPVLVRPVHALPRHCCRWNPDSLRGTWLALCQGSWALGAG